MGSGGIGGGMQPVGGAIRPPVDLTRSQSGVQQAGFGGIVDWVVGRDSGAAWRSAFTDSWVRGPTGGVLPERLANGLRDVGRSVPSNAAANGMHAWHAGSNAFLAEELGVVGAPLILLGGIYHESPLDWESFKGEQHWQGTVNHVLDSVTDIGANVFGLGMGYLGGGVDRATRWGNYIPGPGEPDPAFGGGGPYNGNPLDAWGQYP
jgi:hypothetical protein